MTTVNREIYRREGTTAQLDDANSKHERQFFYDTTETTMGYFDGSSNKKFILTMDDSYNIENSISGFKMNGGKIDLDADADTSITADTDDQIDYEVGGSDLYVMTTTKFKINHTGGMQIGSGSDEDQDLLVVNVTGAPLINWDESEDRFSSNKGLNLVGATTLQMYTDKTGNYRPGQAYPTLTLTCSGVLGIESQSGSGDILILNAQTSELLSTSTSSYAYFYRHCADQNDGDEQRRNYFVFTGRKADTTYHYQAGIHASHSGTGDDYKSNLHFSVNTGTGAASDITEICRFDETGLLDYSSSLFANKYIRTSTDHSSKIAQFHTSTTASATYFDVMTDRNSDTADNLAIRLYGHDDGDNDTIYGQILTYVDDNTDTTEDSTLKFSIQNAGTLTSTFEITADKAQVNGDMELYILDSGAGANPTFDLYRDSASPANNDILGEVQFNGKDDGDNKTLYGKITGRIGDKTGGAEYGRLDFYVMLNASDTRVVKISEDGLLVENGATIHAIAQAGQPTSTSAGALWLDTDAGGNGHLKCYANGDWRTVATL